MGAKMLQRPSEPYLRQQFPEVYGALSGLMGTAPDEQGSVLDPNTARARAGAEIGFPLGTALQVMPFAKPAAAGVKALGPTAGRMAEGYLQRTGGILPLDVYHGSPYKFDAFDASKIGSGEGAQVYGHGLYFAEVPDVAKGYQATLGHKGALDLEHEAIQRGIPLSREAQIELMRQSMRDMPPKITVKNLQNANIEARSLDEDKLAGLVKDYKESKQGSLYKVDLPDEQIAKMLDWDKPLSQQSKEVQAAMDRAFQLHLGRIPQVNKDTFTGAQAYEMLTGGTSGMQGYENIAAQGSKALRQAGIPGIKYLDQQSRNAGGWHLTSPDNTVRGKWMLKSSDYNSNGVFFDTQQEAQAALKEKLGNETRNFVTFPGEEQSLTILERNGQPSQNSLNSFIQ
jgi:hypothetical protein